jgi:hypothetical protein
MCHMLLTFTLKGAMPIPQAAWLVAHRSVRQAVHGISMGMRPGGAHRSLGDWHREDRKAWYRVKVRWGMLSRACLV